MGAPGTDDLRRSARPPLPAECGCLPQGGGFQSNGTGEKPVHPDRTLTRIETGSSFAFSLLDFVRQSVGVCRFFGDTLFVCF